MFQAISIVICFLGFPQCMLITGIPESKVPITELTKEECLFEGRNLADDIIKRGTFGSSLATITVNCKRIDVT